MKILLITLSNIGDVLLTLPAAERIREIYSDLNLSIVVGERASSLFDQDPRFEHVWVWCKNASFREKMSLIARLMQERFDRIINFRNPVYLKNERVHHRLLHFEKLVKRGIASHQDMDHLDTKSSIWISDTIERSIVELLTKEGVCVEKGWIVVTPGSLNMTKRWKLERFVQLCRELTHGDGYQVLLAGDESDRVRSQVIVKEVSSAGLFDLCGKTSLLQLAFLIRQAKLLICHDSAPLHMASLFGTPVVAIFGPTDPQQYGPWRENSRVVRRELFCSPCEKSLCVYHHECMNQISPKEILERVNELL